MQENLQEGASVSQDFTAMEQHLSAFPPPPSYYKMFTTPESLEQIKPPPPPEAGSTYLFLGIPYTTVDSVPKPNESGIKEIFRKDSNSSDVHVQELKKLNRSLLFSYLELLEILLKNPTAKIQETAEHSMLTEVLAPADKFARELKEEQIHLLFINISYLLNLYRPHQAREQVIQILKDQLQRRKESTEQIRQVVQQSKEKLLQLYQTILQNTSNSIKQESEAMDLSMDETSNPVPSTTNSSSSLLITDDMQQFFDQLRLGHLG